MNGCGQKAPVSSLILKELIALLPHALPSVAALTTSAPAQSMLAWQMHLVLPRRAASWHALVVTPHAQRLAPHPLDLRQLLCLDA